MLRDSGYDAFGVEYSTTAVKTYCENIHGFKAAYSNPNYTIGSIRNVPLKEADYPTNSADLATSFEVLEHIPERDILPSLEQVVRISKGKFFGTMPVCLANRDPDPPEPAFLHISLHNRTWWDAQWALLGCLPDYDILNRLIQSVQPVKIPAKWAKSLNKRRRCVVPIDRDGIVQDTYRTYYAYTCPN